MCYCTLQVQRWIVFLSCAKEVWFVSVFICPVALFLFVGGVLSSKVEKVREMKGKHKGEEILGRG